VAKIIANLSEGNFVQSWRHEATAIRYEIVSYTDERVLVSLGLDVCCDFRSPGAVFMSPEEFLAHRRRFRQALWIPAPATEFAYYLVKRLAKSLRLKPFDASQGARLSELYREDPTGCLRQLARFFPAGEARLIAAAAESGHWEPICRQSARLFKSMLRKMGREHPLNVLRYWVDEIWRRITRIAQPTGLMVALLGPDGAGKTTLMARVKHDLSQVFRHDRSYHLRPHLEGARRVPGGVSDPHAEPPRGAIPSLAKLGYWWVDYTVGYFLAVVPQLMRCTFVLFDRCYHALLVDQRRFRYGGPVGLARLVGRFIPQPHLVILLDTPPEVAQARKQDITFAEAARQRGAYLQLVRSLPNGYVVDASRPLEQVATETEKIILDYLAERTARRLGLKGSR